jgi:hypothetical protein
VGLFGLWRGAFFMSLIYTWYKSVVLMLSNHGGTYFLELFRLITPMTSLNAKNKK